MKSAAIRTVGCFADSVIKASILDLDMGKLRELFYSVFVSVKHNKLNGSRLPRT